VGQLVGVRLAQRLHGLAALASDTTGPAVTMNTNAAVSEATATAMSLLDRTPIAIDPWIGA